MISVPVRRAAAALAVLCLSGEAALADLSTATFWSERRESRARTAPLTLASLPSSLPSLSRSLAPGSGRLPVAPSTGRPRTTIGRLAQALPADRMSIVDLSDVPGTPVIVIQDIHLQAEAQRNIAAALTRLMEERRVGHILLEGAFGPLDFERFRAFPAPLRGRLANALVERNRMGGPSLAAIAFDGKIPVFAGADDEAAYRRNVAAVTASARERPRLESSLAAAGRSLEAGKAATFSPELAAYDRLVQSRRAGAISFGDHVFRLDAIFPSRDGDVRDFLDAYRLERDMDVARVEAERRSVLERLTPRLRDGEVSRLLLDSVAYRAGRIAFGDYHRKLEALCARHGIDLGSTPSFAAFLRYVALSDGLNVGRLLERVDAMEREAGRRLATTASQKDLLQADRARHLATRLVRFEMTPSEWSAWKALGAASRIPGIAPGDFRPFEDFYAEADQRTDTMVARLMDGRKDAPALLVVGGFHTPGLAAKLRSAGVPFIVASPRLTSSTPSPTRYLDVFTREKTPLERLFAGERLSVNPASMVWGGRNVESRRAAPDLLHRAAAITAQAGRPVPAASGVDAEPVAENVTAATSDGQTNHVATGPTGRAFEAVADSELEGTRFVLLRPVVTGLREGMITALFAYFSVSHFYLAFGAWLAVTASVHYALGIVWWNPALNRWDVRRYVEADRDPDGPLDEGQVRAFGFRWRAIDRHWLRAMVAAATGSLGFIVRHMGSGFLVVAAVSVAPQVLANLSRELRVNERRLQARAEKRRKFDESGRGARLADSRAPPDTADLLWLRDQLENLNDLASLERFATTGAGPYRLAMIMQPGTTGPMEGPGFKKFNDAIGYDLMNRVWRYRNEALWQIAESIFEDVSDRAGRPVLTRVAAGYKSLRFAIDLDALSVTYPDAAERDRELERRLDAAIREANGRMVRFMTVEGSAGDGVSNRDVVAAVRSAQSRGRLPSTIGFPLYWGLSDAAQRGTSLESVLAADSQTLAAVNMLRANLGDGASLGSAFDEADLRKTLDEIEAERAWLSNPHGSGVSLLEGIAAPGGRTRVGLSPDLVDAFRKKPRETVLAMVARRMRPGATAAEVEEARGRIARYIGLHMTLDYVKPWVGSAEKEEALALARTVNTVLDGLSRMRAAAPDERRATWATLQPRLKAALASDVRAPFLGSTFEFYGRVPAAESPDEAVLFVDFRGFGALILNELEETSARLAATARDGGSALKEAFAAEMLTLGDPSLDTFAASLRRIRAMLESRYPGGPMQFYFGGDDITVRLPRRLAYDASGDRPDPDLLEAIFSEVPAGMRIRMILASTAPFADETDAVVALTNALTAADELGEDAKRAEESWTVRGAKVEQVVAFTDHAGARWRMPMFDNRPGRPELVHPGHDDNVTYVVKQMMGLYRRVVNRNADAATARQWAEVQAEDSIIVVGLLVAAAELILLPGMSYLATNFTGVTIAIIGGAVLMASFHELTVVASGAHRAVRRYLLRRPVRRSPPPGEWWERAPVRFLARTTASLAILDLAFLPLIPMMSEAGGVLMFESLAPFIPSLLIAWLAHALWNAFAPPAWRLSLVPYGVATGPNFNRKYNRTRYENQDTPAWADFPDLGIRFRAAFDGYNGDGVGRIASRAAARAATASLKASLGAIINPADLSVDRLAVVLARASRAADQAVARLARKGESRGYTAGSISLVWGREVLVSQAGDTSAYIYQWDADGISSFEPASIHNVEQWDVPIGAIRDDAEVPHALVDLNAPLEDEDMREKADVQRRLATLDSGRRMPAETATAYFNRNIVGNTIGEEDDYFPVVYRTTIREGRQAALFLFSDGVTDNLTEDEIRQIIATSKDVQEATTRLVAAARQRMRAVDRLRGPIGRLLDFYDTLGFNLPGDLSRLDGFYRAFVAKGRRLPSVRPVGVELIRAFQAFREGLSMMSPVPPEVSAALEQFENDINLGDILRAKVDDSLGVGVGITNDGRLQVGSIIDRWLRNRLAPAGGARHWFYGLYTVALVNWELALFLPILVFGFQGGWLAGIGAFASVLPVAWLFQRAHPGRTAAEKAALFRLGLTMGAALAVAVVAGAGWASLFAPAAIHSVHNLIRLRRLLRAIPEAAAFRRSIDASAGPGTERDLLVRIASSLPVRLGVANADGPNQLARLSNAVSAALEEWTDVDALDGAEAARLGEGFGVGMRRAITGENERSLTMGTERAIFAQIAREKPSRESPPEVFGFRFISSSPDQAVAEADEAIRAAQRLTSGRNVLVVEGVEAYEAVAARLRDSGLDGVVPLVLWDRDAPRTMKQLQDETAEWLATRGFIRREDIAPMLASARFRLMIPDSFPLPDGFMDGLENIDRYRVFLLVQAVILAVEIRPQDLGVEKTQRLIQLIATQA